MGCNLSSFTFPLTGLFSDADVLPHALIAASGGDHAVVARGDDCLRRLRSVNFESPATQNTLFALVLGNASDKAVDDRKKRSGASIALKLLVLPHLSRSVHAANQHALALKVVFDCWFGQSSPRLKLAGLQLFTWILTKAQQPKLTPLAPLYLSGLLKFLASFTAPVPTASTPKEGAASANPNAGAAAESGSAPAPASAGGVPRPMGGAPTPNYNYAKGASGQSSLLDAQLKGNTYNAIGQLAYKFGE
jgi:hypothetical protein